MVKLHEGETAYWIPFIAVADVDAQVARAQELGAKVLVAPVDVPQGRASVIRDPQGAALALFQTR